MERQEKYRGVIPAFYACYDNAGEVDTGRVRELALYLWQKGVKGLYLCGSSGECVYQTPQERKIVVETVAKAVGGKMTLIVHVGGGSTRDGQELAHHAQACGADAIASIPPIYFRLPETSIADYWNDISAAAPKTDFFIYNIPQLAGVSLTPPLLRRMLKNPRLAGVKNSSMPVQDIEVFKQIGGKGFTVFNGPDEQYAAGRLMGADGGIGGTYAVMPELFMAIDDALAAKDIATARKIQYTINNIIAALAGCEGNLYAALKAVLCKQGLCIGSVRGPLSALTEADAAQVQTAYGMIEEAKATFAGAGKK